MLITPETTKIGWVGTGVMGHSMCRHLMDQGFQVSIFSRTREKAADLIAAGASWCDSPKQVAQASDVVFSIVGLPSDVREVFLSDHGVLAGCKSGNVVVDMTTSEPQLAIEITEAARALGVHSVDAPVSGGDVGAQAGTLSIMIGGESEVVAALEPCWKAMGKTYVRQGDAGCGQHAKIVNQILVAAGMIGVCESLLYAQQSGLDLDTVLKSVSSGAAGSWALSNLAPRIVSGHFDPGFFVDHFVKDLGIAMQESKRMSLKLPGLELACELYDRVVTRGDGHLGTHALQMTLAEMSELNWASKTAPA
ncbi:NAD(P)-dependent oxidoreductase [Mariniblastus sp.]|nr:NAD(P)-dependent oxidoreductase [Mariniblastus sp.]MDA7885169.1 NAD(P)-dependent oxidoreductase [bacterium]MDA7887394.1 NAD(P)-dependent oxidoreductase [bacterium]MDA7887614.1 NAD(P)-dependent oxidoreductase [bacterium]MDA7903849.1 NAD(P)-dependent oxidoreductase [Mariniblastus sp.]